MILRGISQYFIKGKNEEVIMKTVLYTVKDGDSLASVAEKFHTSRAEIIERNRLSGEPFEGMKLIVEEREAFGYTVRPFETVESIAAKFGKSVEDLKKLNGASAVFVGQRILVPSD